MEIQLRVVLLSAGVLILLIVLYDFFKRKPIVYNQKYKSDSETINLNKESRVSIDDYVESDIYQSSVLQEDITTSDQSIEDDSSILDIPEEPVDHIIAISIMSRDEFGFIGDELLGAIESAGLIFGKNDIFHYFENDEEIFCLVMATEPGYFIIETIEQEHIPGVTLILLPDQVSSPTIAFDRMIRAAKQIAFAVNGELFDQYKSPLTLTTIDQYQSEIKAIASRKK